MINAINTIRKDKKRPDETSNYEFLNKDLGNANLTKITITICLEVTISKKVWFRTYVYRPPYNKDIFFSELSKTLSLATRNYGNIIIIGDLNTDNSSKKKDNGNYLSDLCETLSLNNLITNIICVRSTNGTSIDVLLT